MSKCRDRDQEKTCSIPAFLDKWFYGGLFECYYGNCCQVHDWMYENLLLQKQNLKQGLITKDQFKLLTTSRRKADRQFYDCMLHNISVSDNSLKKKKYYKRMARRVYWSIRLFYPVAKKFGWAALS